MRGAEQLVRHLGRSSAVSSATEWAGELAVRDDSLVRNREATFMAVRAWLARHLAAACVLGAASIASAQITTGTITGTVRDGQGGVIPGATVILTSDTQGTKSSPVVTDADRRFRVREPQGRHLHHRSRDAVVQHAQAVWRCRSAPASASRPALSCSRSAARRKSWMSKPKRRWCSPAPPSAPLRSRPTRSPTCRLSAVPSRRSPRWRRASPAPAASAIAPRPEAATPTSRWTACRRWTPAAIGRLST